MDRKDGLITLEYESFFLVNVYVPNSGEGLKRLSYRKQWDDHLVKYIAGLDAKKPVILTGDLMWPTKPSIWHGLIKTTTRQPDIPRWKLTVLKISAAGFGGYVQAYERRQGAVFLLECAYQGP